MPALFAIPDLDRLLTRAARIGAATVRERTVLAAIALTLLAACSQAPPPSKQAAAQDQPPPDLTVQPWYAQSTAELAAFNRRASQLVDAGKFDDASAVVGESQPLADRLLAASHPTLEAMEAASGHDDLVARLYVHNGRYGWARMTYQKILVRWRAWKPQTPEIAARIKAASAAVAECDKHL
jgi:hypothetical protein